MSTNYNKVENLLKRLGFSEHEVLVYLDLSENGSRTIMDISRTQNIFRPAVYKAIARLKERGLLIEEYIGKRKHYSTQEPKELRDIVKDISIDLEETLPDLEDIYSKKDQESTIKILEGKKGIGFIFSDVVNSLQKGDTFYRYTSEKDLDKVNSYLPKDYRQRRDAKRLERLVISNTKSGNQKKPRLERFIKYIPQENEQFEQNIIQLIYGDKIAIIDLNTENSFIFKNKLLADFQKTIFKLFYKRL